MITYSNKCSHNNDAAFIIVRPLLDFFPAFRWRTSWEAQIVYCIRLASVQFCRCYGISSRKTTCRRYRVLTFPISCDSEIEESTTKLWWWYHRPDLRYLKGPKGSWFKNEWDATPQDVLHWHRLCETRQRVGGHVWSKLDQIFHTGFIQIYVLTVTTVIKRTSLIYYWSDAIKTYRQQWLPRWQIVVLRFKFRRSTFSPQANANAID